MFFAVGNLRSDDYKLVGAAAAIGAPWGYWIGAALTCTTPPLNMQSGTRAMHVRSTSRMLATPMSMFAGYKYYLQKSSARMGVLFFTAAALGHVAQMSTGETFCNVC